MALRVDTLAFRDGLRVLLICVVGMLFYFFEQIVGVFPVLHGTCALPKVELGGADGALRGSFVCGQLARGILRCKMPAKTRAALRLALRPPVSILPVVDLQNRSTSGFERCIV